MYKIKTSLCFIFMFIVLTNCKHSEVKADNKNGSDKRISVTNDTLKFKKWLRDTISIFNKNNEKKDFKCSEMKVYQDSLSIEFNKKYNLEIKFSKKDKIHNKDVDLILTLLKQYEIFPKRDFILDFEMLDYYDVPRIDKIYEHTYEIPYLNVIYDKKRYSYNFMKGNLKGTKVSNIP